MQSYSVVLLVSLVAAVAAQKYYTGKWNNIDTHAIIDNDRAYNKYRSCILDSTTTGCPPEAMELKKVLIEALKTTCEKCSPELQVKAKDTLSYICEKRPASFAEILTEIDPDGKYRPAFEAKFGTISGGC